MSRGYGAVQRRILALLAQNDADPMRDFEQPPFFQSWTPMQGLVKANDPSWYQSTEAESARRAIRTLGPPGRWRH